MLNLFSKEDIKNIAAWEYQSSEPDFLTKLLLPSWVKLAETLPPWLHPNFVSLAAFIFTVIPLILLPEYQNNGAFWVGPLLGLSVFIYTTLDAIDGMQARKTNTSSPIGEIIDHTVDFIGTMFIIAFTGRYLNVHDPFIWNLLFPAMLFYFYLTHLRAIKTKKVDMLGINNPVLALALTIGFLSTAPLTQFPPNAPLFSIAFTIILPLGTASILTHILVTTFKKDRAFQKQILTFLFFTLIETGAHHFYSVGSHQTVLDILPYKLYLGVFIVEVLLAKIAQRSSFHPHFMLWVGATHVSALAHPAAPFFVLAAYYALTLSQLSKGLGVSLYRVSEE